LCNNSPMCSGCLSSQDFDAKPFGSVSNGSMGDKGIAMKNSLKYDGDNGQDKKFEGLAPETTANAAQVENSGRQ